MLPFNPINSFVLQVPCDTSLDTWRDCYESWGVGGVVKLENANFNTWPFQEPKLEVPTIYKAHVGLCKGISPQNMALYGTVTVPPFSQ